MAQSLASRNIGKLRLNSTMLLVCDIQEKFRNNIQYFPQIVEVSKRLLDTFNILSAPIICTEQYPKGLGPTVPDLELQKYGIKPFDKTQFSMCIPDISKQIEEKKIKSLVICGIEAHVCVQNTALDLIEKGLDVHVVADAVSSRAMVDRMYALERLRGAGAFITTSEAVILGMAGGSHHPNFKELQKIIFKSAPDSGLLNPAGITK